MTAANEVVFLLDVDNPLLDTDRIVADLMNCIASKNAMLMLNHPGGATP